MNLKNTNLLTLILTCIIIVIILNLIIPNIVLPHIKHEDSHPKGGIDNLNFGHRFMNLMYLHAKSPILTSLVLCVILTVSVLLGSVIKIRSTTLRSVN